mgnify:CR=1 FL=1
MINSSKLELIIWNKEFKGGEKVPVLELTNAEKQTLIGILKVEKSDLEELMSNEDNAKDKKEFEGELERVNSMLQKLQ